MAEKKKSIIEEALLEAKSLEDAVKANTKEILASTMKQEIDSVVRESLKEEDEIEGDVEQTGLDDGGAELDVPNVEDDLVPAGAGENSDASAETDILDLDVDLDLDAGEGDDSESKGELPDDPGMKLPDPDDIGMKLPDPDEMEMDDQEGVYDMTEKSDDEVMSVFKKLSGDDEIEVVKDEDGIHLTDHETGAEYYIKESDEEMTTEGQFCEGCGYSEDEDMIVDGDEAIYEVELDEDMYEAYMESKNEEDVVAETEHEHEDDDKEPVDEDASRRKYRRYAGDKVGRRDESRNRRKPIIRESKKPRKPLTESKNNVRKESYEKLLREYKELKTKNGEYKEALKVFKTKINEVALFNQNLAHVTKLFTEHSTTKKEKMSILGRFDTIETIKESKSLYKTIEAELMEKTPINESVERKVNKTVETSKSNLNESTAYVDPQINAIKDLMRRIS